MSKGTIRRDLLKEDITRFYRAAMAAVCHCYDHTKGLYPDNCSCDTTERVHESIQLLVEEHKRLIKKYDL